MFIETKENDRYIVRFNYHGDLTTVDVWDKSTYQHARGHALRNGDDEYRKDIGEGLAYFRAFSRLCQRNLKLLIRQTI